MNQIKLMYLDGNQMEHLKKQFMIHIHLYHFQQEVEIVLVNIWL